MGADERELPKFSPRNLLPVRVRSGSPNSTSLAWPKDRQGRGSELARPASGDTQPRNMTNGPAPGVIGGCGMEELEYPEQPAQ